MSWWRKLFGRGSGEHREDASATRLTPDQEFDLARHAFERDGDAAHALHHLAEALADDPTDPARLHLLDEILAATDGDPERLLNETDRGYYAAEALRAYAYHRRGGLNEALELLLAIARAKPDAPYLEAWAVNWVDDEAALPSLDAETLDLLAGVVVVQLPEHAELRARERRAVERLLGVMDRYGQRRQGGPFFRMWRTALVRKLGRFDEALAEAVRLYEDQPQWQTAIAVASVHRQRGDFEQAVASYQKALGHDPNDVSARNDVADMYLDRGDFQNALHWYEDVLQRQKDHPWALPSSHFCRLRLTGEDRHLKQLTQLADGPQPNERAGKLLQDFSPYLGFLPEPGDASANLLRQLADAIREKGDQGPTGEVQVTLSCIESPSNRLAFEREMAALGNACQLKTIIQSVPRPDPREPLTPVEYLLWEYEGTDARPALPPPSQEIAELVAALAARRYNYWSNWNETGVAAERLGPERLDEFLAVMVHPPAIHGGASALAWVPRVQLVAAQILAQIDGGWAGSLRRRVLLDIARGPRDWTTQAAIIALAQLAQYEKAPALTAEVRQVFQQLLDAQPDHGHCAYLHALLSNWLFLPDLPERERKKVWKRLQQWTKEQA